MEGVGLDDVVGKIDVVSVRNGCVYEGNMGVGKDT